MALLSPTSRIGQAVNKLLYGNTQLSSGNALRVVPFSGPAIYPDPNTLNFVRLGYCGNASVFTIVSKASRKFGYLPRYLYQIEDKRASNQYKALIKSKQFKYKQAVELQHKAYDQNEVDNDLSELLIRPNENEGQDVFYQLNSIYYMVCGESFIRLNRGYKMIGPGIFQGMPDMTDEEADKEKPLEMQCLPPQYVEIIPDPYDVFGVIGYYFVINGQREFVRKNDIIHWKQPNPDFDAATRTHMRGLSPLRPGNKLVTQDESANNAAVSMQQNQGAKGILSSPDMKNLSPVQQSQVETVTGRKINGDDKKGGVATLPGTWLYSDMSMNATDMQLVESIQKNFVRLCNLYDVPAEIFLENSTFANLENAVKALITGLLLPMACSLNAEMDRVLIPAFGLDPKRFTTDVDVSTITELQDDMLKLVQATAAAWWKTGNEKRAMTNDEKSDDPNMDKILAPNNLMLLEDLVMSDPLNSYTDGLDNTDTGTGGEKDPNNTQRTGQGLPVGSKIQKAGAR